MSNNSPNHPIISGKASCKIISITHNTGMYTPEEWKELRVEFFDGTTLEKIRHQTKSFPVSEGQEIMINWVAPYKRPEDAWYYSTS